MTFDPAFRYDVVHPVLTTYASGKSGTPRRVFAQATTTVGIRHVDGDLPVLAALVPIHEEKSLAFFGLEGALWTCVGGTDNSLVGVRENDSWDSRGLAARLGSDWVSDRHIGDALRRSPVIAAVPDLSADPDSWDRRWTRGTVLSTGIKRRVIEDGSPAASAAVERFFAENVVIAGGRVLIRCGDPLLRGHSDVIAFPRGATALGRLVWAYPVTDGVEGAPLPIEVLAPEFFDPASRIDSYLQILPDQVRWMANYRLGLIAQPRSIVPESEADALVTRLRGQIEALAPLAWSGAVGGVSRSEGAALVEAAYAIVDDLEALGEAEGYVGPKKKSSSGIRSLLDHLVRTSDRVVLGLPAKPEVPDLD